MAREGISVNQLARALGRNRTYIGVRNNYEKNHVAYSCDELGVIAAVLGVPPAHLLMEWRVAE